MSNYSTITSSSSKYFTSSGAPINNEEILTYSYRSPISQNSSIVSSQFESERVSSSSVFSSSTKKPSNQLIIAFSESREKDKRELAILNDKFASYVERVRFLEVHNKKLQLELDALRNRSSGDITKIRELFELEMRDAKIAIEQTGKDKLTTELKLKAVDEEAERFRNRYNDLLKSQNSEKARIEELERQLAENEADINLFKRRLADLEETLQRYKAENLRLISQIQKINAEIEAENLRRVKLENDKAQLEEELSYVRIMQKKQVDDISVNSYVEVEIDSSEFFKSELAFALQKIREEYEQLNARQKAEIDETYKIKIQQIHSKPIVQEVDNHGAKKEIERLKLLISEVRKEIAYLKSQNVELEIQIKEKEEVLFMEEREASVYNKQLDAEIAELLERQAQLIYDLEQLTKVKISLEDEILTYRRLLEGDGNQGGLRQVVEGIEKRAKTFTVIQAAAPQAGSTSSYIYKSSVVSSGSSTFVSGSSAASRVGDYSASRTIDFGDSRNSGQSAAASSVTTTTTRVRQQYQY